MKEREQHVRKNIDAIDANVSVSFVQNVAFSKEREESDPRGTVTLWLIDQLPLISKLNNEAEETQILTIYT